MVLSIVAAALALQAAPTAAAVQPPREVGEKSADAGSKVICKKFLETGSLVRGYRMCKTKIEWERARDELRRTNVTTSCRSLGEGGSCS
jgi:hypothetical protein